MNSNNKGIRWLSDLDNTIAENSKLVLILLIQFAVIVLLIVGYMKMADKLTVIVDLPKTIKEEGQVKIGKEYADELFYKMWFREDIEVISDFNHKTIDKKIDYLKNRMYPPYFYKHIRVLKKYQKKTQEDLITQKFNFNKKNIETKLYTGNKAKFIVKGFYSKSIDEDVIINAQPCQYEIGYFREGGYTYVETFKTTCK